ncbi:MAG: cupredoxin domain-containing protein [Actinobacteria bacterium]|nr:cupredoxin domain-containing protein [Actinomycetota bacterium]
MRTQDDARKATKTAAVVPVATAKDVTKAKSAAATTASVKMYEIAFQPKTLTVARGATVTFDNQDTAPHTVTDTAERIDSGVLNPGQKFSLVVTKPLDYVCTIHPSMHGRIELSG